MPAAGAHTDELLQEAIDTCPVNWCGLTSLTAPCLCGVAMRAARLRCAHALLPLRCCHAGCTLVVCACAAAFAVSPCGLHADDMLLLPPSCSIHWVTSPQLALLEDTMRKMERVDAYILMMGGGGGVDVFNVGFHPPAHVPFGPCSTRATLTSGSRAPRGYDGARVPPCLCRQCLHQCFFMLTA